MIFAIWSTKGNYKNTFSDWAGPVIGGSVSYLAVSGSYGTSSTYSSYGAGVGTGLSLKFIGGGSVGYTYLIGSPLLSAPVKVSDWRPQPGDFGL